jgi:hypothetical protein
MGKITTDEFVVDKQGKTLKARKISVLKNIKSLKPIVLFIYVKHHLAKGFHSGPVSSEFSRLELY